jgi:hypothetical protein
MTILQETAGTVSGQRDDRAAVPVLRTMGDAGPPEAEGGAAMPTVVANPTEW